jgi:zinc transporter ZupT
MHWGTALMFNFLSSLLAAIGFFIGAAISTSVDASDWLLAIAAGSFLYISLVDLVSLYKRLTCLMNQHW